MHQQYELAGELTLNCALLFAYEEQCVCKS